MKLICFSEDGEIPEDLQHLIQIYEKSNTLEKLVILSIVDHNKYSKETIMKHFQCSKYKVDQARKLKSQANGLEMPKKVTITRNKLNIQKCEHFLDFLFNNKLLQDVAYGVTNIKFDNGDCQKIAHAVLVTKYSHTISFYMDACRSSGYCPLSKFNKTFKEEKFRWP